MGGGVLEGVGAPDGLVVVDEVVGVGVALVDELDGDFLAGVGEGAEIAVLAGVDVAPVGLAELALVATGVVELLDLVVGLGAEAALLVAGDVGVGIEVGPALVLVVVVVEADLALVGLWVGRRVPLRGQGLVLKRLMSKRKYSPSSKCGSSSAWRREHWSLKGQS